MLSFSQVSRDLNMLPKNKWVINERFSLYRNYNGETTRLVAGVDEESFILFNRTRWNFETKNVGDKEHLTYMKVSIFDAEKWETVDYSAGKWGVAWTDGVEGTLLDTRDAYSRNLQKIIINHLLHKKGSVIFHYELFGGIKGRATIPTHTLYQ